MPLHILFDDCRVAELNQISLNGNIEFLNILNPEPFGLISLRVPLVVQNFIVFLQILKTQQVLILLPHAVLLQLGWQYIRKIQKRMCCFIVWEVLRSHRQISTAFDIYLVEFRITKYDGLIVGLRIVLAYVSSCAAFCQVDYVLQ